MTATSTSPLTVFQDDTLAFQRNAFQILTGQGLADVSIVEIRPRYANVVVDSPSLILARVSIVEISS